ncbi:MAG TPA: NAD-binding protein, partial [Coleofasciculaceae cyanobacterium]
AIVLTERGINGGASIKALVFLTILSTVFLQGLTAGWVARLLGVTSTQITGVVIVGCSPLSLLVGRLFRDRNEPVVLIDTDPESCQQAEQEGFKVFSSSALDANVLEEAGLANVGTFLAMTNNGEVNLVLAQRAAEEFYPPRVLAVFPSTDLQSNSNSTPSTKVQQAFATQISLKTWNGYLSDKAVKLGETTLREDNFQFQQAHLKALIRAEEVVPILIEREERLMVVPSTEEWQVGDRIIYLLHDPRPKLLRQLSGSNNQPLSVAEKLSRVEEIPMAALSVDAGQ